MLDKLKADFDGILELVNKTPAPLQEMAFKMILEQWFAANTALSAATRSASRHAGAWRSGVQDRHSGRGEAIPHGQRHHDRNPRKGIPPDRPRRAAARV